MLFFKYKEILHMHLSTHSFIIYIAINLNNTPTKMNRIIFHFKVLTTISDKTYYCKIK